MIENESSFVFKKINFHPTTSHGIFFGPNDRNADKTVYYTSGNKILGWSYETGLIFDKIPIESKKIRKVYENEGSLFILDVESNFYQFDFKTKQILARLKLNEGHESSTSIVNFAYSKTLNKFYFIDNQSNLIVVILRGTHPNCTMEINSKSKLNSENNSKLNTSIMVLNDDNKILMLATGRKLFLYNLTNDQQREIEFQKAISCAIFANENKIILGDYGGKIHTITNFNNRNVNFL